MKISTLFCSTALAIFVSGAAAYADVTPEEVWENWKAASEKSGTVILSESEVRDGDTLVITGVSMESTAEPAVTTDGKIGEIRLQDLGDGTVEITQSETYSITITTPAIDGIEPPVAQTMTLAVNAPGARTVASGTVEAMSYDFTLPVLEVSAASAPDAAEQFDFSMAAVNGQGAYLVAGTEPLNVSGSFAAESLSLAVKAKGDAGTTDVDFTAAIGAFGSTFDTTILAPEVMADMAAALAAGFAFKFDTTYGATSYNLNVVEAGAATAISGGVESGSASIGMDANSLSYLAGALGLNLTVSGAEIPFPEVKLGLGEYAVGLTMPTSPSAEPAPFSLLVKLVDLAVSDEIWGMIDPGASLPRDPATIILDSKGTARLTADLFSPEAAASDLPPGELISLDLTQLLAKVAGAELTGTGAFTFDNTDLVTFGGVPSPTGKIDLKIVGVNTLMDTLISMGLMSEEDAMGARMMMSMFANPGAGEDEFTSVLEFKDKGFYANGQRLQ